MKRLGILLGLSGAALVLTAVPASASPSVCVNVDLSLNGQGTAQSICLPPAA
ncbi:hypothetical protein [Nocardioides rubriscoriae]|uniref:hypothetical protein n=1 Tax=Nocardioides rubriscoriae TaxID=642762 RepID=UPI0014783A03|nr:hypothetical protein [Nocardioides rubriscoriae]